MSTALAAALAAVAAVVWSHDAGRAAGRLARVQQAEAPTAARVGSPRRRRGRRATAACTVAAVAVAALAPPPVGVAAAVVVAVAGPSLLGRLESRAARSRRERIAADAPLALDLVAACLLAGAPVVPTLRTVAAAVPGPLAEELTAVARALELGTAEATAWTALTDPSLQPAARAFTRAAVTGAPLADIAAGVADDLRAEARARQAAAARRAAVQAVAPLGLCFLPAFVLAAVVPVAVGLARHVLG